MSPPGRPLSPNDSACQVHQAPAGCGQRGVADLRPSPCGGDQAALLGVDPSCRFGGPRKVTRPRRSSASAGRREFSPGHVMNAGGAASVDCDRCLLSEGRLPQPRPPTDLRPGRHPRWWP
jgi:hypothetical protein